MESYLESKALEDFLKHDEELIRLQNEIDSQASKFGFNNVAFHENKLPQLEKRYGPTDPITSFNHEDESIPTPSELPNVVTPKVIKYDVKGSVVKPKQGKITSFDDFAKSKWKVKNKTPIPPQDFAPLKRIDNDENENINWNIDFHKQDIATKTTTYKDLKQTRYDNLPSAVNMNQIDAVSNMSKTKAPSYVIDYKRSIEAAAPNLSQIVDDKYYQIQYKDEIQLKPRHIPGFTGKDAYTKYYQKITDEYTSAFLD